MICIIWDPDFFPLQGIRSMYDLLSFLSYAPTTLQARIRKIFPNTRRHS